jgi:hypothetical protein
VKPEDLVRPGAPRIVVHESDACQGNITGWDCTDCDDDACEHECHFREPGDVPVALRRLAVAAMNANDALPEDERDMTPDHILAAVIPEIERRTREQVATAIEARGDEQRGDPENPLTREEWACYGDAARIARGEAR